MPAVPTDPVPTGIRLAGIGDEAVPDLPGQIAAVAELGWNRLELRTIGGVPVARLGEGAFRRAAERLRSAGVGTVGVASKIGDWSRPVTGEFTLDTSELEVLARRCAVLGTRLVRIMSYPCGGLDEHEWGRRVRVRLRELARRAEDRGLVLAHENCAGWAGDRADRMLDLVTGIGSPALRLLFDTGNGVAHGYPSPPMLRAILPYVVHVHVKDALTRRGEGEDVAYVPPGTGEAEVEECLRLLLEYGYDGVLSIEPHVNVRPHLGAARADQGRADQGRADQGRGDQGRDADGRAAFVACGRALERLLADNVHAGGAR